MMRPHLNPAPVAGGTRRNAFVRLCRGRDGTTAIEAAVVFPVLVLFLLGIMECSRALWIQTSLQYAVTVAARCASLGSATCTNVPSYAASQVYAVSVPITDFTYSLTAACGNAGYTKGSQVVARYTFHSVVGGLIPAMRRVPLTATACHP